VAHFSDYNLHSAHGRDIARVLGGGESEKKVQTLGKEKNSNRTVCLKGIKKDNPGEPKPIIKKTWKGFPTTREPENYSSRKDSAFFYPLRDPSIKGHLKER